MVIHMCTINVDASNGNSCHILNSSHYPEETSHGTYFPDNHLMAIIQISRSLAGGVGPLVLGTGCLKIKGCETVKRGM